MCLPFLKTERLKFGPSDLENQAMAAISVSSYKEMPQWQMALRDMRKMG